MWDVGCVRERNGVEKEEVEWGEREEVEWGGEEGKTRKERRSKQRSEGSKGKKRKQGPKGPKRKDRSATQEERTAKIHSCPVQTPIRSQSHAAQAGANRGSSGSSWERATFDLGPSRWMVRARRGGVCTSRLGGPDPGFGRRADSFQTAHRLFCSYLFDGQNTQSALQRA